MNAPQREQMRLLARPAAKNVTLRSATVLALLFCNSYSAATPFTPEKPIIFKENTSPEQKRSPFSPTGKSEEPLFFLGTLGQTRARHLYAPIT
jgi:hypothetical protein